MGERETAEITELPGDGMPAGLDGFAEVTARVISHSVTTARTRILARFELALEATRRPELRAVYDRAGQPYREQAGVLLAEAGSADPERHARMLVAWAEGVMFDTIAGAGGTHVPTRDELRASMAELLAAILPGSA